MMFNLRELKNWTRNVKEIENKARPRILQSFVLTISTIVKSAKKCPNIVLTFTFVLIQPEKSN